MIVTRDQAVIRAGKNDLRIFWRGRDPARLATAHVEPVFARNTKSSGAAGNAHRRVVLLRAINVIRKIIVERDTIELCGRLILFAPTPATVERNICAAVITIDHPIRVVGRDPEIVIVAMRHTYAAEGSAAVV